MVLVCRGRRKEAGLKHEGVAPLGAGGEQGVRVRHVAEVAERYFVVAELRHVPLLQQLVLFFRFSSVFLFLIYSFFVSC